MSLVPNSNPNLYHFAEIRDNKLMLIPIIAFNPHEGTALDMYGHHASVIYDKHTSLIHRQGLATHIDEYLKEPEPDSSNGVFDNNGL